VIQFFAIVAGIVALAGAYGILHDQVTARICLEYFTVAHPRIMESEDPTLLALAWGVIATWWFALPFGLIAAGLARLGPRPQLSVGEVLRIAALSLAVTGVLAGVAGAFAWITRPPTPTYWSELIPARQHGRFVVAAAMHLTSYVGGAMTALGALVVIGVRRFRPTLTSAAP
jgi:hypothetical protein